MSLGNTNLIDYGIYEEDSDIRAHVSYTNECVYVYETRSGIEAIETGNYRTANAYQGGVVTGVGYLVPPDEIEGCQSVSVPQELMNEHGLFKKEQSTSEKGDAAVNIVASLLKAGRFPINLHITNITDKDLQVSGIDIYVGTEKKIQVKCDFNAGPRPKGTGNLFIQVRECNPFHLF